MSASSSITGHPAKHIDDADVSTAWIGKLRRNIAGQSISFSFTQALWDGEGSHPDMKRREKVNFNGFAIVNGFCESDSAWKSHGRAKTLRIYLNDRPQFDISLADSMNKQLANCKAIWIKRDDKIRVKVIDAFPGDRFQDVAISELTPEGAH